MAWKHIAFTLLMLFLTGTFLWLGVWQLERLSWKRDLIAQTEAKLAEAPFAAPAQDSWAGLSQKDLYSKIYVTGRFIPDMNVFTLASTKYGRGYWVMSPFKTDKFTVLINRGFVTSAQRDTVRSPTGMITINGLLRLTEPDGSAIQDNNSTENKWFSRDIAAISSHLKLTSVAPYFIDEASNGNDKDPFPIKGLTVVQFRNNHLQYALTWFALAALSFAALSYILWTILTRKEDKPSQYF